jgi:hypothetical protein
MCGARDPGGDAPPYGREIGGSLPLLPQSDPIQKTMSTLNACLSNLVVKLAWSLLLGTITGGNVIEPVLGFHAMNLRGVIYTRAGESRNYLNNNL